MIAGCRLTRAMIISVACVLSGAAAAAQTPAPTKPPFAVIEGVAVDSLHRDYLRGAVLIVEGALASATTDSLGRFRLDSVPPGLRRIEVLHPMLDTIGISLRTAQLQLNAGDHLSLAISTPSAQTVVGIKCSSAERRLGPAALIGLVHYAESEDPATGAQVMLDWVDYEITGKSLRTVPRRRIATVAPSGRFQICGIPADFSAALTGASQGDTTSAINVVVGSLISLVGLELPDPAPRAVASLPGARDSAAAGAKPPKVRAGTAVVSGRVFDPTGAPLARARVSIDRDTAYALTDADGRFVLRNLRSGTRSLTVRRLGFEPADVAVALRARRPTEITVRLATFVAVLDTVRIRAAATVLGLERVGFSKRRNAGTGYYLTPDEIARRNAYDLVGLLGMAPMLRRVSVDGRQVLIGRPTGLGQGCVTWFVDGIPWLGGGVEEFIWPSEVAAVEVYSGAFAPVQFTRGFRSCETVVIWTKQKIGVR